MIIKMKIKNTKEIEEKTFKLLKKLSIKANEEKKTNILRKKISLNTTQNNTNTTINNKINYTTKIKLYAY